MQHTPNGKWIGKHAGDLSHAPITINGIEFTRVHVRIPVGHVDHGIDILRARIGEFREETTRTKIVVILIDLSQGIAHLEMRFEIVDPMLLGAVHGYSTVGTLKVDMLRRMGVGVDTGQLS